MYPQLTQQDVILQIIPELETGGAERGCIDMAIAIQQAGGTSLVTSSGGRLTAELSKHQIPHFTLSVKTKNPFKIFQNYLKIKKIAQEHKVKLLHVRSRAPAWSTYLVSRATGIPFVSTFHAPYHFSSRLKKFYNSAMSKAHFMIANSDFVRRYVIVHYKVPLEDIQTIHRGIDPDYFDPDQVQEERVVRLFKIWRLRKDTPVILMPGRLTEWKGQKVVLEALHLLKRRTNLAFQCVFVGSDQGRQKYKQELLSLTQKYGLSKQIVFADHCDDMVSAYALSDIVIHASIKDEAFGRVIVEAQAMGKPIIVSENGASNETVISGVTGFPVEPGNAQEMSDQLQKILYWDEAKKATFAHKARQFVLKNYTTQKMCSETLKIYKKILNENYYNV